MTPKIVDKDRRKKEIATIALDLFAEKGFVAASISDIAKAAGIGKGTIYEYFDTKDDLIFNSIVVWVEQFEASVMPMLADASELVDLIRKLVLSSMEVFINDPRTLKVMMAMFQLFATDPDFFHRYNVVMESMSTLRKVAVDLILQGVSEGIFRPEVAKDAEKIAINLLAYMDGIALHHYMSGNYFDLMEQVNFHLDNVFKSLKNA